MRVVIAVRDASSAVVIATVEVLLKRMLESLLMWVSAELVHAANRWIGS